MASGPADHVVDVTEVSTRQVWAFQMDQHHLTAREPKSEVEDVIGHLCGLDARLDTVAELSLWARTRGLEDGAIHQELWPDRALIKTWAMDEAQYFLPASEYPMWAGAIRSRNQIQQPATGPLRGLGDEIVDSVTTAIGDVLSEATLPIEEISKHVRERVSEHPLSALSHAEWRTLLRLASLEGNLCIVPSQNERQQFTHPARWIGELDEVDPQTGREEATLRYLWTYGPATADRFAQWMGIPTPDAERWIQDVGDRTVRVNIDGEYGWLPREAISRVTQARPQQTVRLLPAFDPYVIGALYEPASAIRSDRRTNVVDSNGWVSPTLVVEGELVGTWTCDRTSDDIEVTVHPFDPVEPWARKEAWVEAVRLSEYFDCDLVFNWRPR